MPDERIALYIAAYTCLDDHGKLDKYVITFFVVT